MKQDRARIIEFNSKVESLREYEETLRRKCGILNEMEAAFVSNSSLKGNKDYLGLLLESKEVLYRSIVLGNEKDFRVDEIKEIKRKTGAQEGKDEKGMPQGTNDGIGESEENEEGFSNEEGSQKRGLGNIAGWRKQQQRRSEIYERSHRELQRLGPSGKIGLNKLMNSMGSLSMSLHALKSDISSQIYKLPSAFFAH